MKENTYRVIMMIGLYLGIFLFLLATIALVKNIQEIKTDPIIYGMKQHEFNSCTCYTPDGSYAIINLEEQQANNP